MSDSKPGTPAEVAVQVRGLRKSFGATHALRGLDLTLRAGRVHALLGANGCGKSTLVKLLAGYHTPDAGEIIRHGSGAGAAIAFVHQDLGLIPALSVTENLSLTAGFHLRRGAISWSREHAVAAELLAASGITCDPRQAVSTLGPTEQTMVAIARAVASLPGRGGVLVLDEPTARLPASEADRLLAMIRRLKDRGVAVLYISHRLDEVIQLADEVTVLRDGSLIHSGPVAETDRAALVRMIVGGELHQLDGGELHQRDGRDGGALDGRDGGALDGTALDRAAILALDDLQGARIDGVTLRIAPGEVMGIAGLVGSGRSELGRLIFGLQAPTGGRVLFNGRDITGLPPAATVRCGLAYVPQDRRCGIFQGLSVGENAVIAELGSIMGRGWIDRARLREAARAVVQEFQVKTAGIDATIETLSGGNQQKVSLGKWLRRDIRLLILDEPTQGIDVGARTDIFHIIRRAARERGIGVLVLDSDLEILAEHCDRVAVMAGGRLVREFDGSGISAPALNHAVYGH